MASFTVSSGASSTGLIVNNGESGTVLSGGVVHNTAINSGGTLELHGTGVWDAVTSGGTELVAGSGAEENFGVVFTGGNLTIGEGGGTFIETYYGGTGTVMSGGVAGSSEVENGGALIISSGGIGVYTTLHSGGTEIIESGGYGGGVTISSGGLAIAQDGASINSVKVGAGGRVDLGAVASNGGPVDLAGTSGTGTDPSALAVVRFTNSSIPNVAISNFGQGDAIDFGFIHGTSGVTFSTTADSLTISSGGSAYTISATGIGASGGQLLVDQDDGSLLYEEAAPCFLAGTLIRTPEGGTAVEDLRVGDEVVVQTREGEEVRAVSWKGSAVAVARPDLRADLSNYPVRILKDAIAEGVPNKDLLVTPDHFAAFEGYLLPVRTLVNDRSIFYDRSQASYTYYHFEAGTHALVYADGMLMDTFLDAGHRRAFSRQAGLLPLRAPDLIEDAVLPWNVHPWFVEPIHRAIAERAKARGIALRETPPALTAESDLHLIADDGRLIQPNRNANGVATFSLPDSIRSVRIVSRTSRKADTIGPFQDDRRFLGVHVGAIELIEGGVRRDIEAHLTDPDLAGWHEIDGEGRWTAGDALVPLGDRRPHAIGLLSLRIISEGLYVLEEQIALQKTHDTRNRLPHRA
jgi:antigen 43